MRQWRKDYQGNLWTKGSRASCCGRFFCCTLMIFLLLLISVVLTIALVSVYLSFMWLGAHRPSQSSTSDRRTSSLDSRLSM